MSSEFNCPFAAFKTGTAMYATGERAAAATAVGRGRSGRFGQSLLTRADRFLIVGVLVGIAVLFYRSLQPVEAGGQVAIRVDGVSRGVYALDQARIVELAGPLGPSVVEIKGGAVRVATAPCHRQICVGTGWVQRTGAVIACLPNRLLVQVEGTQAGHGLDAVSR